MSAGRRGVHILAMPPSLADRFTQRLFVILLSILLAGGVALVGFI